jgi:cytochrome c oxidase subunit 2
VNRRNNNLTIYIYELAWVLPSIAIPVGMLVAIALSAFALGIHLPGVTGRVDPARLDTTPPFSQPGVRQVGPGRYEVVIVGRIWQFTPNEIRVPAGSEVTFIATSRDVVHGFKVQGTPINMMLVPGQVSTLTTRFDRPGEYLFVCHEYCGTGHHVMFGRVIVEPATR